MLSIFCGIQGEGGTPVVACLLSVVRAETAVHSELTDRKLRPSAREPQLLHAAGELGVTPIVISSNTNDCRCGVCSSLPVLKEAHDPVDAIE